MVCLGTGQDRYEIIMALRILDLFSGIGGFSYAAERLVGGFETIGFCEIDPYCQKVLKKHWPDVPIHEDVKELANDADRFRGLVDVVCGGYPCQPFSLASANRKGQEDDRHLWPQMLRIIQATRPRFVIGENVAGHITLGLDTVLSDLEAEGYTARAFVIPACAKDARHRRDRVWILAHTNSAQQSGKCLASRVQTQHDYADSSSSIIGSGAKDVAYANSSGPQGLRREHEPLSERETEHAVGRGGETVRDRSADVSDTNSKRQQRSGPHRNASNSKAHGEGQAAQPVNGGVEGFWLPEPAVGRVANGIPRRVDRLRSLGNSIVPAVAAEIFIAIKAMADGQEKQG